MISSVSNGVIRRVRRLRKRSWRERRGQILIEGHHAVRTALEAGAPIPEAFCTPSALPRRDELLAALRSAGARVREVTPEVMAHLTSLTTAPDVLAVGPLVETRLETALGSSAVVLDAVHDPATAGAVTAIAASVGIEAVVFGEESVDAFAPKTVRSARGAHYVVKVIREVPAVSAAERLADAGARLVALAEDGPTVWSVELEGPIVLVVGEGRVASDKALPVAVPALRVGPSLTARTAVVLYEWLRRGGGE